MSFLPQELKLLCAAVVVTVFPEGSVQSQRAGLALRGKVWNCIEAIVTKETSAESPPSCVDEIVSNVFKMSEDLENTENEGRLKEEKEKVNRKVCKFMLASRVRPIKGSDGVFAVL